MNTKDKKLAFEYDTIYEISNLVKENTINSKSKESQQKLWLSFDLGSNKLEPTKVWCNLVYALFSMFVVAENMKNSDSLGSQLKLISQKS